MNACATFPLGKTASGKGKRPQQQITEDDKGDFALTFEKGDDGTLTDYPAYSYTGSEITPQAITDGIDYGVKVVYTNPTTQETDELRYGDDYEVTCSGDNINTTLANGSNTSLKAAKPSITVKIGSLPSSNYHAATAITLDPKEFVITRRNVDDLDINLEDSEVEGYADAYYWYTGDFYIDGAIEPLKSVTFNGDTLVKNTDYKVNYSGNKKIGEAGISITGLGKSNFTGTSAVKPFYIYGNLEELEEVAIEPEESVEDTTRAFLKINGETTGRNVVPSNTEIKFFGKTVPSTEYEFGDESDIEDVDDTTQSVTVIGKGYYVNDKRIQYQVTEGDGNLEVELNNDGKIVYQAQPINVKSLIKSVKYKGNNINVNKYITTSVGDTDVGSHKATVTYTDDNEDECKTTITYTIVPKNLDDSDGIGSIDCDGVSEQYWTGQEITPSSEDIQNLRYELSGRDPVGLTPDDYTITCGNNIAASTNTAYLTISGTYDESTGEGGNYTGEKTLYFDIVDQKYLGNAVVTLDKDIWQYTGSGIEPEATVTYNEEPLTEGEDYSISYSDNTEIGTGAVTITAIEGGAYNGKKRVPFTIVGTDESGINISISPESVTYNATQQKPDESNIVVTDDDGNVLTRGTDYTLLVTAEYKNGDTSSSWSWDNTGTDDFVKAGTYTFTATEVANQLSTAIHYAKAEYKIKRKPISDTDVKVDTIKKHLYTGSEIKPEVTLRYPSSTDRLTKTTDYSVSYSSNTYPTGVAKAKITGNGNYKGERTENFEIYLPLDGLVVTATNSGSVSLRWNKTDKASGYRIRYKNGSTYSDYITVSQPSSGNSVAQTISDLAAGTTYKFEVTPYVAAGNNTYNGDTAWVDGKTTGTSSSSSSSSSGSSANSGSSSSTSSTAVARSSTSSSSATSSSSTTSSSSSLLSSARTALYIVNQQ